MAAYQKKDPRFDPALLAFLGRACGLKEIADYETGPDSHVSDELARSTVKTEWRFVDVIAGSLG